MSHNLALSSDSSEFRLYDGYDLKTYLMMRWKGPDALAVCQAHRGLPVGFFCSGIQFCFLCLTSFLYLDLYVLGNDALIS